MADITKPKINEIYTQKWVEISDQEFKSLRDLIYNNIGINLSDEKKNLMMGRFQKILRARNFSTFKEYYDFVSKDSSGEALSELANSISTNHTFFYRENDHFEYFLKTVLPEVTSTLVSQGSKDLRIWSAGCSSGEEPYDLMMLMLEYFGNDYKNWTAGILATDISEKALNIARKGVYSADRIHNLPELYKKKYFKKAGNEFEIIDNIKNEVVFRRFNLMNPVFTFKKKFNTIFCRNVMIYFDEPTRIELVNKFYNLLVPGGYLFIGHSETLKRDTHNFQYIKPAVYKKV